MLVYLLQSTDEDLLLLIEVSLSRYKLEVLANFTTGLVSIQDAHNMLIQSIVGVREAEPETPVLEWSSQIIRQYWDMIFQVSLKHIIRMTVLPVGLRSLFCIWIL